MVCFIFLPGSNPEESGHQGIEADREKYLGKPGIQPRLICTVFYGIKISLALIPWPVCIIQDLRFTIFCIFSGLLPSYDKVNKTLLVFDNMTGFPLRKR